MSLPRRLGVPPEPKLSEPGAALHRGAGHKPVVEQIPFPITGRCVRCSTASSAHPARCGPAGCVPGRLPTAAQMVAHMWACATGRRGGGVCRRQAAGGAFIPIGPPGTSLAGHVRREQRPRRLPRDENYSRKIRSTASVLSPFGKASGIFELRLDRLPDRVRTIGRL